MYGFRGVCPMSGAFVGRTGKPLLPCLKRRGLLMRSMFARFLSVFRVGLYGVNGRILRIINTPFIGQQNASRMRPIVFARKTLPFLFACISAHAYMVIEISTSAPTNLQSQLIASVTTQYNVKIINNPVGSAYTQTLLFSGFNPNYNPPPLTSVQFLQQINLDAQYIATVDSYTYATGFGDGMSYQQTQDESLVNYYAVNCSTTTPFILVHTSTSTFNPATCADVAYTIDEALFQQSLSTPTAVPGDF
jgi:hypothetical protein